MTNNTNSLEFLNSLEFFRDLFIKPTNIFEVKESLVKSSVDIAFGDDKQELQEVSIIHEDGTEDGTVITPIYINENHVFFSVVGDFTMKIDAENEFTYTTFKKKGKSYVFSNDKTIIKTCLDFLKFNFNKE